MRTGSPAFDSTRLSYSSHDRVNGIDLELLQSQNACTLFLNVHSHPVPCAGADSKHAQVTLQTADGTLHHILAYRLEGGQRLRLPDTARDLIISLLKENKPFTLSLPGYRTTIEPASFSELLAELEHPPLSLPFHLPF